MKVYIIRKLAESEHQPVLGVSLPFKEVQDLYGCYMQVYRSGGRIILESGTKPM